MGKTAIRILFGMMLASVALGGSSAAGQQSSKRVVVKAGHVLDVKTGKTLSSRAIVIEGDKIVSVVPIGELKPSPGDNVIDLSQATVLPGLIDAHTHLTMDPKDAGYESLGLSIPRQALIGARNARLTLEAGFTTRAQCWRRRLQRRRFARRDQCWRYPRTTHAGERSCAGHHRRTLRQQSAGASNTTP